MIIKGRFFTSITLLQYLGGNVILSIIILAIFFRNAFQSLPYFLTGFIWSYSICMTQWAGPMIIGYYLEKKLKWIDYPVARTFIEIISILIWSVVAFVSVQMLMMYLVNSMKPADSWVYIRNSIIYTFLISLFISLVFTAIGFFKAWRKSVLREAELKSEMLAYKYESLRNQINPHFLFNSFNVLSDLVYDNQEQAVQFIRQMSELFRYVIESRDKELVTIEQELDLLKAYTFMLKSRFGSKLVLNVNLQSAAGSYMVPMTLQMLVENAVKHNEVSAEFPLIIDLRVSGDFIEVENALRPKTSGGGSTRTGLRNIVQQYSFFTNIPVEVLPSQTAFLVRIPVIKVIEK